MRPRHLGRVELVGRTDAGPLPEDAYLSLHRLRLRNRHEDGRVGQEYGYDAVLRRWMDAVALILVGRADGRESICLRSCIRPPLLLRPGEGEAPGFLWELPAGLLEDGEDGAEGILRRAAAEALEETGYAVAPGDFRLLPGAPFVSPGVLPERLWFAVARIDRPDAEATPAGDGSEVEGMSRIWWVPVDEALRMCDRGELEDMKTELGLRRFAMGAGRDLEADHD